MRRYEKARKTNPFAEGFRLGLIFGALGAIIILGRDSSPQQPLEGATPEIPEEVKRLKDPTLRVAHTEPTSQDSLGHEAE